MREAGQQHSGSERQHQLSACLESGTHPPFPRAQERWEIGGRMRKEQGFELAGTSLQRAWWMLRAESKPFPLKDSKGTHALQTGRLVGPVVPSAWMDLTLRRARTQMGLVAGRDIQDHVIVRATQLETGFDREKDCMER